MIPVSRWICPLSGSCARRKEKEWESVFSCTWISYCSYATPFIIERNLFIIQKQQEGIALVDSGGVPGDDGKGSSGLKKWAFAVLLLFFGLFLPNFTVVKPYEPLPAQVMQIAQENDISGGYYVTSENGSYNIHVDGGLFHLNRGNRVTCKTAAPRRLNNIFHCHIKAVNPGNVFLKNRKYNDTLNK